MYPVLENGRQCLSLIIIILFLIITLLGTICSAEISSSANGQAKMAKPKDAASSSAKEVDRVEGSGNSNMMEWSDDEDLGGEGSGAQVEGSGDTEGAQDQAIVPFITSEDVRQTEPTVFATTTTTSTIFTEPRLETRPPTRPPVIAKPPAAGSTIRSSLSILTAFVVLWAPLLLH